MGVRTRRAAPTYDSGITTLPNTLTVLTVQPIRVDSILLCNLTATAQTVTVTDRTGTGSERLSAYPLQGRMTVVVDLGGVLISGVQWQAGAASAVNAQLLGNYA